jgi:hypothetical protein
MITGEIYWADCPFEDASEYAVVNVLKDQNAPTSKRRPVVIIRDSDDAVVIVESRSKYKSFLTLALKVDFANDPKYYAARKNGMYGISHFYVENMRTIEKSRISPDCKCRLHSDDLKRLLSALGLPPFTT